MAEKTEKAKREQATPGLDAETVRRVNEGLAKALREATDAFAQMTRAIQLNRVAWLAFNETTAGKLPDALAEVGDAGLTQLLEGSCRLDVAVRQEWERRS